jgi:hypothetical protein
MKSRTCYKQNGEPLTEFHSEYEAYDGADYVNSTYSLDLEPYHCHACLYWHLSPLGRKTPNKMCKTCVDKWGSSKSLYETYESAERRAFIILKEQGVELNIYDCPNGQGYHLTKRKSKN